MLICTAKDGLLVAGKHLDARVHQYLVLNGETQQKKVSRLFSSPTLDALVGSVDAKTEFAIVTKKRTVHIAPAERYAQPKKHRLEGRLHTLLATYLQQRTHDAHQDSNERHLLKALKQYTRIEGFLDKTEFSWTLSRLEKKLQAPNRIAERKSSNTKKKTRPEVGSLLLGISAIPTESFFAFKQDLLHYLQQQFGVAGYVSKYTDCISICFEGKDTTTLERVLSGTTSASIMSRFASAIRESRKPYPVTIPELTYSRGGIPIIDEKPFLVSALDLWNLDLIGTSQAHQATQGNNTTVAVIDTGVDYTHQELRNTFGSCKGYNVVDNTTDPMDDHYHGTHVAGTVAGRRTGVAPAAQLYAVKVLNHQGVGSEVGVVRGIEWCIDQEVNVINMSLGSPQYSPFKAQACLEAMKRGILVVAAAGNNGRGYEYPAANEGVVAVAAVDREKKHASFSNISDATDISAPGVQIASCIPNNQYGLLNGTSMASPHLAGVAALAKSLYPGMSFLPFVNALTKTAEQVGEGEAEQQEKYGAGLVRADRLANNLQAFVQRYLSRTEEYHELRA